MLFGPALLGAIPAQTTLSRLASLNVTLEEKGKAFEKGTLTFLHKLKLEAKHKSIKIDGRPFDYDVLLRWGDRIFLFECKCRALSANSLIAAVNFRDGIRAAVRQVHGLVQGLQDHPEILDDLFGPGASSLLVVPCVLNGLPFATLGPIEGIHFIDNSAFGRFFESPVFNLVGGSRTPGEGLNIPTQRLWADASATADDLERLITNPPQLELALRQITECGVETVLGPGAVAESTRSSWRPRGVIGTMALMMTPDR